MMRVVELTVNGYDDEFAYSTGTREVGAMGEAMVGRWIMILVVEYAD